MKKSKKILAALFALLIMCSCAITFAGAIDQNALPNVSKTEKNLRDVQTGAMCIAHKGDWRHFPENSIEGALSAVKLGADVVEIDVRCTVDGYLVVFDDISLERMCVDAQGNSVLGRIDEITLEQLRKYRLRDGKGGPMAKVTDFTVPTLEEMLDACRGVAFLRIDHAWEYRDEVYHALLAKDMLGSAMINSDALADEINDWVKKTDNAPMVAGTYTGGVVFSTNSFIKSLQKGGQPVIGLATGNSHAILFDNAVTKNFGDSRILIDTTDPSLCGDRDDGFMGWDDLLSRGYTLFQTDDVQAFARYRDMLEPARVALNSVVGTAQEASLNISAYSSDSAKNLTQELEAAQALLAKGSISVFQMETARATLRSAVDDLQPKDTAKEQEDAFKITPMRAVLAVIALAVVILVQVYIYLKSDNHKRIKAKRKAQKEADKNLSTPENEE